MLELGIPASDLGDLFCVLHDGVLCGWDRNPERLELTVRIRYLAARVRPEFSTFRVALLNVSALEFRTWPNDADVEPDVLLDAAEIFRPHLDILEGAVRDGRLEIVCNQPDPHLGYCGGELRLACDGANVRDEAGKSYSFDELKALAAEYWREWKARNARHRASSSDET